MKEIIIIGGGASGLIAASILLQHGCKVILLEADDRLGGRIHTLHDQSFSQPVEKGGEFIHGELPVTLELLEELKLKYVRVEGKMYHATDEGLKAQGDFIEGWDELIIRMNDIEEDVTVDDFLSKFFAGTRYEPLRRSVRGFAAGFDLADTSKASILSLREEWMEETESQYRMPGGYDQLINHLAGKCIKRGAAIHTSHCVKAIRWQKDQVQVITTKEEIFSAHKIVVTVSAGVLSHDPPLILFQPAIPEYIAAIKDIGFGNVVKIMLEFRKAFWENTRKDLGFVFSDQPIPTWWTQAPSEFPLLTGWVGGQQAKNIEDKNDNEILDIALQSLSGIFKMDMAEIHKLLTASVIANWKNNDLAKGGYSYNTLKSVQAKKILNTPISNTIFFAGEALYDGASPGTVEAALVSGRQAAERIVNR